MIEITTFQGLLICGIVLELVIILFYLDDKENKEVERA